MDSLRDRLREMLAGGVPPGERGQLLAEMKQTLVHARLAGEDLRAMVAATRAKVAAERTELDTVRRRMKLAEGIGDTETVTVALKYERQHAERLAVLERKLEAQEAECALAEGELAAMTEALKGAVHGGGTRAAMPHRPSGPLGAEPEDNDALSSDIDQLTRSRARQAKDLSAEEQLAALKRKMGK